MSILIGSNHDDPTTTATNSGTPAANATTTNVAQSAIAFNYNDGLGYSATTARHPTTAATATTTRHPAAAFDSPASGC
jgi:hypothetical protein